MNNDNTKPNNCGSKDAFKDIIDFVKGENKTSNEDITTAKPHFTTIDEVNDNNGWTVITDAKSLPKPGVYSVLGKSGSIETVEFKDHFRIINVWLMYYTHWRPKVVIPMPIY